MPSIVATPAALRSARLQLWWFRHSMPDKLHFAGCLVGGGALGLFLALFADHGKLGGISTPSLILFLWLLWVVYFLPRMIFDKDYKPGKPASAAFIVAAFAHMPADLRGHLHAELQARSKRERRALDRPEVISAMEHVERRFGAKALACEAARDAALAEQRSLLAACNARPRLNSKKD